MGDPGEGLLAEGARTWECRWGQHTRVSGACGRLDDEANPVGRQKHVSELADAETNALGVRTQGRCDDGTNALGVMTCRRGDGGLCCVFGRREHVTGLMVSLTNALNDNTHLQADGVPKQ